MKLFTLGIICAAALFSCTALPHKPAAVAVAPAAEKQTSNPKQSPRGQTSDSTTYLQEAAKAEKLRVKRRLSAEEFVKMAAEPGTVVLDARSALAHAQLRIKGSVNLPYTDMGADSLAKVIPSKETKVLIYCRNNLLDRKPAEASGEFPVTPSTPTSVVKKDGHAYPMEFEQPQVPKNFGAGLNIPTYISLYIYGYRNVWELDPMVDPNRSVIEFESMTPQAASMK